MEFTGERPQEDPKAYEQRFYCETALGDHHDRHNLFTEGEPAIERAIQLSYDDDVWAVYQIGKEYDEEDDRQDRIIALVYQQRVYHRVNDLCMDVI